MAFTIPTIKDLVVRARNAFKSEMKGVDAWLWPNNIAVAAKVFGGLVWQLFGRLAWIDKQRFAMTATGYELERHGMELGIGRKTATHAEGYVYVTSDYPLTVYAGTRFTRADGTTFDSTVDVSLGSGEVLLKVPVLATVAGKNGNTYAGTELTCLTAFSYNGSTTTPVVGDDGIGQGADIESYDSLRERILHRKRKPPMGGAEHDYWAWARSLPGVSRVFVEANAYGAGTVGVWFLMDDIYVNGIPQAFDVAAVQAYLDVVKPVTATVIVAAPKADCLDLEVKGLYPDTTATRQAAAAELQSVFRRQGGVSTSKKPVAIRVSWLWSAISNATGEEYHTITAPTTDLSFPIGTIPCLASVRFIK